MERPRAAGPLVSLIPQSAMRGALGKTTTCRTCGSSFERIRAAGSYSYCKRCTARADREIARKTRRDRRECGRGFVAPTRSLRYCSKECKDDGRRRTARESARRRRADPEARAMAAARARAWEAARRGGKKGRGGRPGA